MKVALINPGVSDRSRLVGRLAHALTPVLPLGLAYIASSLRSEGHSVIVIDQFAEQKTHQEVADQIRRSGIEVTGISCLTCLQEETIALCQEIRRKMPATKIVLGNVHASALPGRTLTETGADAIVLGEGELTFASCVRAFEKEDNLEDVPGIAFPKADGSPMINAVERISEPDSLPFPAWDLFDLDLYPPPPYLRQRQPLLPLIITRGCPFHCTFCSQNHVFPGKVQTRDVISVVDELQWAYRTFGARHFAIQDSIFPYSKEQAFTFANEIIRRGLHKRIVWFTELRTDMVEPAMLKIMKRSGLYLIWLGIESASKEVLQISKKHITPEQSERAVKMIHEAGIISFGLFMLGLPGETYESARQTIDFAVRLPLTLAKFNRAIPYPGSQLYDLWRKQTNGYETPWHRFNSWIRLEPSEEALFIPEKMTSRELVHLQNLAVRRFYLNPRRLRYILRTKAIRLPALLKGSRTIAGQLWDDMLLSMRKKYERLPPLPPQSQK